MEPKTAVHEDKITKSLGQWIRRDKTIHLPINNNLQRRRKTLQ